MDYLEMMASVAEVTHLTDDGECESLFQQLNGLISETHFGLDSARDQAADYFEALSNTSMRAQNEYISVSGEMLAFIRDWQLGGFLDSAKAEAIDAVERMVLLCETLISEYTTIVDDLAQTFSSNSLENETSVLAVSLPRINATIDELLESLRIVSERLGRYRVSVESE